MLDARQASRGAHRATFYKGIEDVEDLKDSLKMLERKITRPGITSSDPAKDQSA
jgi:hypothetical protein